MQRFASIQDGVVAQIIELPDDIELTGAFHPDFLATVVPAPQEAAPGWILEEGEFQPPGGHPSLEPGELSNYAAHRRWRREVGGITVAGVPVATDDRSKLMIAGARLAAQADPDWSTPWHGSDGGIYPLDGAAIVAISDAVSAHMQQSFVTFAAVKAGIASGAITTTAEIDAAFA